MSDHTLILGAHIINEGKIVEEDVYLKNGRIHYIGSRRPQERYHEINAEGLYLMPGIIDDQVHFREPGLTYKGDISSESKAAAAGGVTSFMEMPNTQPVTSTQSLLEQKFQIAAQSAYTNHSFFLGATGKNIDEIKAIDVQNVCGVKIFMGSSTGDLLVDDDMALESIFQESPTLIATHCEDEELFKTKLQEYKIKYCNEIPPQCHEYIRSAQGCLLSSTKAIDLALRFKSRLHILHITTAAEVELFDCTALLRDKMITSEVCVHHLHFDSTDYQTLANKIKCNPSIKAPHHRLALIQGMLDDRLDIIATDHAPHILEEKIGAYLQSASGLPLVQHGLQLMLTMYHEGSIRLEKIVEKMCHNPAICFRIRDRGYIREGYFADLVLIDPQERSLVLAENLLYKCGWSPLENAQLRGKVHKTWVNGALIYDLGQFGAPGAGHRLQFDR